MSATFEVGKSYWSYDSGFTPITILKRTEKTVWVAVSETNRWMMRIRHDENGNEYVTDSKAGANWRDEFTYSAIREVKE